MNINNRHNQEGFIALMTVIIISAVLLVMMVAVAGIALRGRFTVLDYESKKTGVALAEACLQTEMLNLAANSTTTLPMVVTVGPDKTCTICKATPNTTTCAGYKCWDVYVRAKYKTATGSGYSYTNIKESVRLQTAASTNLDVDSWEETNYTADFGACTP